jgi:hypothetical protein
LTQAQSTLLQALYSYNADLAEFDRATATQTIYSDLIDVTSKPAKAITTTKPQGSTTSKKTKTSTATTPTPSPRSTP